MFFNLKKITGSKAGRGEISASMKVRQRAIRKFSSAELSYLCNTVSELALIQNESKDKPSSINKEFCFIIQNLTENL